MEANDILLENWMNGQYVSLVDETFPPKIQSLMRTVGDKIARFDHEMLERQRDAYKDCEERRDIEMIVKMQDYGFDPDSGALDFRPMFAKLRCLGSEETQMEFVEFLEEFFPLDWVDTNKTEMSRLYDLIEEMLRKLEIELFSQDGADLFSNETGTPSQRQWRKVDFIGVVRRMNELRGEVSKRYSLLNSVGKEYCEVSFKMGGVRYD